MAQSCQLSVQARTRTSVTDHHREELARDGDHDERQAAVALERLKNEELAERAGEGVENKWPEQRRVQAEEGRERVELRMGRWMRVEERDPRGRLSKQGVSRARWDVDLERHSRRQREGDQRHRDDEREERHEEHHLLACSRRKGVRRSATGLHVQCRRRTHP